MVRRIYLFPFRTQKSSFVTLRVVGGSPPARVGRCYTKSKRFGKNEASNRKSRVICNLYYVLSSIQFKYKF